MTADVLAPTVTQNATTGQIEKVWTVAETIKCYAESILTDAVSDDSSGKQFGNDYSEYEFISIKAGKPFSKRTRFRNIRGADGSSLWPQYERPSHSMVFEVQGCIPLLNPFGAVMQYKILAKRVEIQDAN